MLPVAALIYFFTLAVAAPQGVRPAEKRDSGELVLRLAVHMQKTPSGATLLFNLEQPPETDAVIRPVSKPIITVGHDWSANKEQSTDTPSSHRSDETFPQQFFFDKEESEEIMRLPQKFYDTRPPKVTVYPAVNNDEVAKMGFPTNKPFEQIETIKLTNSFPTIKRIDLKKTDMAESKPIVSVNPHNREQGQQRLQFTISLGGMQPVKQEFRPIKLTTTERPKTLSTTTITPVALEQTTRPLLQWPIHTPSTTTESVTTKEEVTEADSRGDEADTTEYDGSNMPLQVDKAFAEGGFGVLTSRCAALGAGLVSDGAGGCTKLARMKKKHSPLSFKSAGANELHSDVKSFGDDDSDTIEVINIHNL